MNKSFNEFREKRNIKIVTKKVEDSMLKNDGTLNIGIDAGNGYCKYSYSLDNKTVISTYLESNVKVNADDSNCDVTKINDVKYDFYTTECVIDSVVRTKETKEHRGLMYKVLSDVHNKTGYSKFNVVFGCSIDSWLFDKGTSITKFMSEAKELKFETSKKDFTLHIEDLKVQPECVVAVYGFKNETLTLLKEKKFLLVDLGNLNVGYCKYDKGLKRHNDFKVNCKGVDEILSQLCNHINTKDLTRRAALTSNQLRDYLQDDKKYTDSRFKKRETLIQEYMNAYILDFIDTATKNFGGDLTADYEILFIGGGSIMLKRFLTKAVSKVKDFDGFEYKVIDVNEDLLFCNSKGFYKRASKLFKESN